MSDRPKHSRPHMPGYGILPEKEGAGLLPWSFVEERMSAAHNYWISSTRPDGTPHAAPVWGLWHQGSFYFSTGDQSVKGKNLAASPAITVHLESGDEVVILEGEVMVVSDLKLHEAINRVYKQKYGLGMEGPEDSGFVFGLKPQRAFAWREKDFPQSATRWIFE
jgi:general stress protein 26